MASAVDGISVIGGLGVFLFSLRYLTSVLNRSLISRFRPLLGRYLGTPFRALFAGLIVTTVVQASSITIVSTMSAITASLVTFEQGYFVMLGATLGTTLKAWVFAGNYYYGRLMVGLGSILFVVLRHPLMREVLEIVIAVGFTFLGLDIMAQGVAPLQKDPAFLQLLMAQSGATLASQLLAMFTGCFLTMALQSSSAMMFLTMNFASRGSLPFGAGAAMVLGMNVGTTVTELLAAVEVDWRGRRLAIAHTLVKSIGALATLFFFPAYVAMVNGIAVALGSPTSIPIRLAIAHTLFNVMNVTFWMAASGIFLRFLRSITPADPVSIHALPAIVRRMLAASPERAETEVLRQMDRLRQLTKVQLDDAVETLTIGTETVTRQPLLLMRDIDEVQASLVELIVQLFRSPDGKTGSERYARLLTTVEELHAIYDETVGLRLHLHRGLVTGGSRALDPMKPHLDAFIKTVDILWLGLLFPNRPITGPPAHQVLDDLDAALRKIAQEDASVRAETVAWLSQIVARLRRIVLRIEDALRSGSRQD